MTGDPIVGLEGRLGVYKETANLSGGQLQEMGFNGDGGFHWVLCQVCGLAAEGGMGSLDIPHIKRASTQRACHLLHLGASLANTQHYSLEEGTAAWCLLPCTSNTSQWHGGAGAASSTSEPFVSSHSCLLVRFKNRMGHWCRVSDSPTGLVFVVRLSRKPWHSSNMVAWVSLPQSQGTARAWNRADRRKA